MRKNSEFVVNWSSLLNDTTDGKENDSDYSLDNDNIKNSINSSENEHDHKTEIKELESKNIKLEENLQDSKENQNETKRSIKIISVSLIDVFSKLNLKSKKNLLDFIEDKYLLELRLVCKLLNLYCDGYIRYCLRSCYFFNVPLTRLTMDFWFAVTRFFFLEAGRILPLNRVRYTPIVAALKHNHKIMPVSVDQMKSHVVVTLDKLLPEHIVFCNHFHPQPHTCDVNLEIKGQSKVFFDEIDILRFVKQYFNHLKVTDDELIRGSRQLTRYRLALYLYQLLKSIKLISEKGNGLFKLSRIEYLVNTGTILRHRIWHQLHASWGSSTNNKKSLNEVTKDEQLNKSDNNKRESTNSSESVRPKRLSDSSSGKISKRANNTENNSAESNNPDELFVEIFLTIADHFQWDS